jgi:putative transposase
MSNKTFQYRIYPTKKQETTLTSWLKLLCETYNAALQERRDAYRMAGTAIGFSQQCAELPACRCVRLDLAEVPSQVLQDAVKRVDLAFDGFFRRCGAGEKPGYPRFKSRFRYDSMTFKQYGNSFSVESGKKNRGTLMPGKARSYQNGDASVASRHAENRHCEADTHWQMVCLDLL